MIEYHFSNITLKVKGPGYSPILNSYFFNSHQPDIIYINGNQPPSIAYAYTFSEINNTVNLIWNNFIDDCYYMFRKCENITEMDLSNFDTSIVTDMTSMFACYYQLSSLNLSHFNTSSVT